MRKGQVTLLWVVRELRLKEHMRLALLWLLVAGL